MSGPEGLDVLATDYDGTIASHGRVSEATIGALLRARGAGLKLVLVTGRMLDDLRHRFEPLILFEQVVAENGAVIHDPRAGSTLALAEPPPAVLLEALAREDVPVAIGQTIIATEVPHEATLLRAIRDLGLDWHVIANRTSVTALPARVTKATGLLHALTELGVAADRTVGIGDAQNDVELLRVCGCAAAVADSLPCLQEVADIVTRGPHGEGVAELIDRWLAGELKRPTAPRTRKALSPESININRG